MLYQWNRHLEGVWGISFRDLRQQGCWRKSVHGRIYSVSLKEIPHTPSDRSHNFSDRLLLLRPWMGFVVDLGEVLKVEVGIDLRGRDIGVAEQLLDSAQVAG